MLSPLCPPPKSPTKSLDGLGQPQHKFLLTDVCSPWTDISNNGSLVLNSSFIEMHSMVEKDMSLIDMPEHSSWQQGILEGV